MVHGLCSAAIVQPTVGPSLLTCKSVAPPHAAATPARIIWQCSAFEQLGSVPWGDLGELMLGPHEAGPGRQLLAALGQEYFSGRAV